MLQTAACLLTVAALATHGVLEPSQAPPEETVTRHPVYSSAPSDEAVQKLMSKVGASCCISHDEGGCLECTLEIAVNSTRIEWSDKGLDDDDARVVAHVIQLSHHANNANPGLMILHLGANAIGDKGATAIAEVLKANTVLGILQLQENQIGDAGAIAFAEMLHVNTRLRILSFNSNSIGDAGGVALGEALRVNPMISKIELNYNKIGDTGGVSIAKALGVNAVLRVLHIGHNKVGDATAKTIADSLRANSTVLRVLYISTNNIGPEGGVAIGEMMRVNVQMQDLNIASNEIGDAGAVAIAGALRVNPVMYKLSLRLNEIHDAGAIAIAEALAVNKVLVEFYCGGNRYSKDSKQKLKDAVEGRPAREGRPVDPYSPTSGGDGKVPFNEPHPDALPALSLIERTVRDHDL